MTLLFVSACLPVVNYPEKQVVEPRLKKEHFVAADGTGLPLRSWLPEDGAVTAVVVGVHGFNDYSNSFTYPGTYLSRHGIAVYAYDQRGFGNTPQRGLWAGSTAYTNDLSCFIKEIRKRHPATPLYVMGESMGGALTIVTMTGENRPVVDGLILVAPAVWGRTFMPWYQRWLLALTAHTVPWMKLTGEGLHISPSDNIEMLRALYRDPLIIKGTRIDCVFGLTNLMDEALARSEQLNVPTLVLYGRKDQVIPQKPIFSMLERLPATTRTAFYERGYHLLLRDLQREKPLTDIATWIADHGKPLPYGTDSWK